MELPLRILIVEDLPSDVELVTHEIRKAGIEFTSVVVDTRDAYVKALKTFSPDIVLSDYSMPKFDGMTALHLLQEHDSIIPFIVITGSMNEETAVECMKAGASDYLIKEHLRRVGPAITAALDKKFLKEKELQAEKALRESEEKYRLLVENANEAIFVAQDNMIPFFNRRTVELVGYPGEEISANSFETFIHPQDREMVKDCHQRRLRGETIQGNYDFRLVDKAGNVKWVEVNAVLISWEDKPATLNFLVDITERKRSDMALRNQMEFLETMINTIPTPIYYKDSQGVYQGCNMQYASMIIGLPKERIIGRTVLDLSETIPPDLAQRCHTQDMELIHMPGFRVYDEAIPCPGGTVRNYVFSKATYTDSQGHVSDMVGIMMDISERKQVEQELKESERNLSIRNKIDEIFLANPGDEMYGQILDLFLDLTESTYGVFGYIGEDKTIVMPSFTKDIWEKCGVPGKTISFSWETICNNIFGRTITEKNSLLSNQLRNTPEGHVPIESILVVPIILQHEVIGIFAVANKASGYGKMEKTLLEGHADHIAPILHARLQKEREETRRKQAEEAQHSQLLFLQQLLDSIPAPVFYKDTQGVYLGCNKAFETQIGLAKKQIVGKTVYDLAPQELAEVHHKADAELLNIPGVQVYEASVLHADGSRHDVIFNKAAYVGTDGHIAGMVGIILDITERKQSEELILRQSKVLDQSLDGIAITDLEGTIHYVNPAWAAMHGYTIDELKGTNLNIFHTPEQQQMDADSPLAQLKQGISHTKEIRHRRKDGTIFPVLMSVFTLKDANDKPTNIIAIARDITEGLRLENLLRQAQKMEVVGQLAGGIAHDFNNMLSPILGYADLILGDMKPDDPHYQEILQIRQSAERAKDLTWQLLAFSSKQVLEMKQVDLRDVISDLQKILSRMIREDIIIKVSLAKTPKLIMADVGKIGQIIMNLAVNAQDAMPQGGIITIETADITLDEAYAEIHPETTPGKYVMLAFSDNGSGIDKQIVEHIFEPFFTTKEPGKGTGLGLATVYGIVKQHGGHIMVYSEPGVGTTFKIYLPKIEAGPDETMAKIPEKEEIKHGTETVLVVEDEEAVRDLICTVMRKHGYTVISARNAKECLQVIEIHKGQIHLLLTDVIMPGMNGRHLYESLSPSFPQMKVIFLSGYTSDVIAEHGVLTQGVNLIHKPFTIWNLLEKVRDVLDG